MMPGLEPLEGRRLLTSIASTLDANNNPVIFSTISGGSVLVDREVPTNDAANPYRPNGLETLSGLTATSVAAYRAADGSPVVLATTGPESYLYSDAYKPTGNPAQPFAWTGWSPISTFVATSFVAVSATSGAGPAIFAIGANSNVYEDLYTGSAATGSFSDFQRLPGLAATTLAATSDGGGLFRVFALTGPASYVYQDESSNTGTTIPTTGWSPLDSNFVTNSVSVITGPANTTLGGVSPDTLMLFAPGIGDGYLYQNSLVLDNLTGDRTSGGF